jgi:hypothetical protein
MASQTITNLSRVWVKYNARNGSQYRVTLRAAYMNLFLSPYEYVLADLSLPELRGRPAQVNITANNNGNLVRRHVPYCWQFSNEDLLEINQPVDGLIWTIQSIRPERRTCLYP